MSENGIDSYRFATRDALKEIHRVLRPGATFGMIWNIEDCTFYPTSLAVRKID
jgi:hypothetical protein